jgi:hypothetical protein
VTSIY